MSLTIKQATVTIEYYISLVDKNNCTNTDVELTDKKIVFYVNDTDKEFNITDKEFHVEEGVCELKNRMEDFLLGHILEKYGNSEFVCDMIISVDGEYFDGETGLVGVADKDDGLCWI